MRKKAILAVFLLSILFCFGCSSEVKKDEPIFFDEETSFHIGFKSNGTNAKARLFFDESGSLHLLHEDTSSPLFGLEEIFSEDGVESHFYELKFENAPYSGGTAAVYGALKTIREKESIASEANRGLTTLLYQTEEMDFSFTFEEDTRRPVRIFGKNNGEVFDINFQADA